VRVVEAVVPAQETHAAFSHTSSTVVTAAASSWRV
jgi:hypothetical protein